MDRELRVCTICARGGSKGVKNKNLRILRGKPLLAYSIQHARESEMFAGVGVSSDSSEILEMADKLGVDWLVERPEEMAKDTAAKLPAIQHCARRVEELADRRFRSFVDLDASAPLRRVEDVRGVVRLLESTEAPNVITGVPARRSPYFNLVELDNNGFAKLSKDLPRKIVRRQDSPACFDMNASIYGWNRRGLFESESIFQSETRLFEMAEETAFDIDSEEDFELVEWILERRERKSHGKVEV